MNEKNADSMETSGRTSLTEHQAKALLSPFGIPVVQETVAADVDSAVDAAKALGYPVVLKALGATLLHKTELGLVHTHLIDEPQVRTAATTITEKAGDALEGFLVQRHVKGTRELVAGLFRDPLFGPVVMFGIGGIYTEALADVSFRVAPLSRADAEDMIQEIRTKALLGPFRGEKAVNRDQLIQVLMGLSRIGLQQPEIAEIDINPLIVSSSGELCAVDALVVTCDSCEAREFLPPVDPVSLRKMFYPRSIAFVGATAQLGKWGHILAVNTISGGYEGEIYLVNPKGGTIVGRQAYRNVNEIPGDVDLAVVTVPADKVMDLIPQFQQKQIKYMILITSGFAEVGDAGRELEKQLVKRAREAGILMIGPNTMGICNPHIKLYCTGAQVAPIAGSTAVVAQSGNMGAQLMGFAEQQGIGIRGFSGSGNEAMITIEDYLEGFEYDDKTRIIMLYIESVKNGRRFFEHARRVSRKKPIILLKGGQSGAGSRAAASHTGAMTSDARVFNGVCRQTGIVQVDQPMDLLDLSAAFSSLPLPAGNRVAIMTLGGGWGVVTADLCAKYGLEIPELPRELIAEFDKLLPPYWSHSNPVDIVGEHDNTMPITIMEQLLKWDGCDAVINLGIKGRLNLLGRVVQSTLETDPAYSEEFLNSLVEGMAKFELDYVGHIVRLMKTYQKPIYGVSIMNTKDDQTLYRVAGSQYKGVFYETPERAVKAMAKMWEYQRFLQRENVT